MHDAIVENDETQVVPVGCRTIAGKSDDACQRARLGPHVAACEVPRIRFLSVPSMPAMGREGRR